MAQYTVYVRNPIETGGRITAVDKYCLEPYDPVCTGSDPDPDHHLTCRLWSYPVDVDGSEGQGLYLRVNYPNVRNIKTFVESRCCGDKACATAQMKQTVTVDLYGGAGAACYYMGSVMFGHVASPTVQDKQVYAVPASGVMKLGQVPSGYCALCYEGAHSHMEISGGTRVATLPCCNATINSSTNIYKFTWMDNPPC